MYRRSGVSPGAGLRYVFEDSGVRLLLTQSALLERLAAPGHMTVLGLDALDLRAEPEHDPQVALHPDNLVYVIYTSGSTGRPQGCATVAPQRGAAAESDRRRVPFQRSGRLDVVSFNSVRLFRLGVVWVARLGW